MLWNEMEKFAFYQSKLRFSINPRDKRHGNSFSRFYTKSWSRTRLYAETIFTCCYYYNGEIWTAKKPNARTGILTKNTFFFFPPCLVFSLFNIKNLSRRTTVAVTLLAVGRPLFLARDAYDTLLCYYFPLESNDKSLRPRKGLCTGLDYGTKLILKTRRRLLWFPDYTYGLYLSRKKKSVYM